MCARILSSSMRHRRELACEMTERLGDRLILVRTPFRILSLPLVPPQSHLLSFAEVLSTAGVAGVDFTRDWSPPSDRARDRTVLGEDCSCRARWTRNRPTSPELPQENTHTKKLAFL